MRKSVLIAGFLAVGVVGWVASGQLGANSSQPAEVPSTTEDPGRAENALMAVRVAALEAQPRPKTVIVNGRTEPFRQVRIKAETYGRVNEIMVRRGDQVEEGEVLGQLALDDRAAKLAEAQALLQQREIEFNAADQLRTKGFRSETGLAQARAQLDAARAVVEQMELDIERATMRAPFGGVVEAGHIEVGDYLAVGDEAGMIVDLDPILVVGYATEREVGALQLGIVGRAELIDGTELEGVIGYVANTADPDTRTYRFELEAPNPDMTIRAGITSQLIIETAAESAHFLSPSVLTLTDEGQVGVKAVDEDDRVVFHPVRILQDTADGIWIGGLPDNVTVITVGHEFVVEGQRVKPVHEEVAGVSAAS